MLAGCQNKVSCNGVRAGEEKGATWNLRAAYTHINTHISVYLYTYIYTDAYILKHRCHCAFGAVVRGDCNLYGGMDLKISEKHTFDRLRHSLNKF